MEKSARYFIVGLFVTSTIFAIIGFLIWLAGPGDLEDYDFYTVEFSDSISGLEEGSDVQYKGVTVGKVLKMRLVPGKTELIQVDIGVAQQTPVRAHTKIVLQTQGIIGLVNMEMSTKSDDVSLPQRRVGMAYPVLQGQGSQLYKVLEDIPVVTAELTEIAKKINSIIDRNHASLNRFASEGLSQFTSAAQELKGTAASARKLSERLNEDPSQIIYPSPAHGVEIAP